MFPYYIFWFTIFLCSWCEAFPERDLNVRKACNIFIISLCCFFFCFFTGFKGNVGIDYNGYVKMFVNYAHEQYIGRVRLQIEPLFWFIMHLFSIMKQPFIVFWAVTSIFGIILKLIFFKKLSRYFVLSLLIYITGLFIERDFDGIRQGLSIGFAYIGLLFLLKGNKKRYLFFLLLAIFTHYTSLIFIISPLLIRVHLTKKLSYFFIFLGFIFVLLHLDFINVIVKFLPSGYIKARLDTYINYSDFAGRIGLNLGILIRVFIFVIFSHLGYQRLKMEENLYYLLLNGFLVSILFFLFFNNTNIIAHRLAYGFREFQILIIPVLFSKVKRNERVFVMPCIGLYTVFLLYRMLNQPDVSHLFNYRLFFNY